MKNLLGYYKTMAVIVFNTLVLFVVLNFVAWCFDGPVNQKRKLNGTIMPQVMLKEHPALMQDLYNGKSIEEISALWAANPNITSHPVLSFMTRPVTNRFYQVGFENCRYDTFVNAANIKHLINNNTWLMGGSSAFGFSMPSNETLCYFLNQQDSNQKWINFAVPGYNQKLEIDKLILLLKKGYRPRRVVFLDGLNDLTQLANNHFEPVETPAKVFHAYDNTFNVEGLKLNRNLLYALPVVRLYLEYKAQHLVNSGTGISAVENTYDMKALYNSDPFLHYLVQEFSETRVDTVLLKKVVHYYSQHLSMLDTLSKAYKFEYMVFYQPNGIMYESNVFAPRQQQMPAYFHNYNATKAMHLYMKKILLQHRYRRLIDLSDLDSRCKKPYIDLTHYSRTMNKMLAIEMLEKLTGP